jgi:hypothetical protein
MMAIGVSAPAAAQNSGVSPVLLLESGPSDNPNYRRMVFTKYLQGDRVSVNYKAYNRTEFIQVNPQTPREVVQSCMRGTSTTMRDLKAFERAEAQRARRGQPPEIARFCIKNVRNWDEAARKRYLDPIFNGLPATPGAR